MAVYGRQRVRAVLKLHPVSAPVSLNGFGKAEGLSARQALATADTGKFLEASGDLIQTGPTGTNVMDLMLGLRA